MARPRCSTPSALTNVAEGEAGGITQHIGAYKVRITDTASPAFGREIVFLDTPGHEAFTRMRARGAKATDIVVLVVAADDGVMPQTLEAIDHAHAAEVPIIVAVNKIDKPEAMPDRVKKQLGDRGLLPEEWGGKTVFVDVSAKKKTNLNLLMEMICLTADLQEVKAVPTRAASGVVLEAKLDRGRGPVGTILVQNGTLHTGDNFVVGNVYGKVRAMFDDRGKPLQEAPPSTPVEILGLEGLPQAGDQFVVVTDREKARDISEYREQKAREATLAKSSRVSLEGLAEQLKTAGMKELNIILKADVHGSVEVLSDLLGKALATTRSGSRCCTPAWARSPRRTCCWRRRRTRSSSASTCDRSEKRKNWPSRKKSTSGCTRSFTNCRTRSSAP